jgi:hypothetical protein
MVIVSGYFDVVSLLSIDIKGVTGLKLVPKLCEVISVVSMSKSTFELYEPDGTDIFIPAKSDEGSVTVTVVPDVGTVKFISALVCPSFRLPLPIFEKINTATTATTKTAITASTILSPFFPFLPPLLKETEPDVPKLTCLPLNAVLLTIPWLGSIELYG